MLDVFPRPYPASQSIPEWYRRMPVETDPPSEHGTLKRCPPFLEAMSFGYIIPLPADVTARLEALEGGLHDVQQELAETQERLDFAERLLSKAREERRIGS